MARVVNKNGLSSAVDFAADEQTLVPVTPSDTVDLPQACSRVFVSVAGTLTYLNSKGVSVLIPVAVIGINKGDFKRIMSTGTAATGIMAAY